MIRSVDAKMNPAMAVALGAGVAAAMGVALHDWAVGLALGVAVGGALGLGLRRRGPRQDG